MDMFEREMKIEELKEILKESLETNHMIKKSLPMRLYNMAKCDYELGKQEQVIIDSMYSDNRKYVKKVHIVGENAIIETYEDLFSREGDWYRVYFNGRVYSECYDSFDKALIGLVCIKNKSDDASMWISKMIGLE